MYVCMYIQYVMARCRKMKASPKVLQIYFYDKPIAGSMKCILCCDIAAISVENVKKLKLFV